MGVHGLWNLLEPSGKPVTLESLENKVLAVDVSIWLHQVVKGFRDSQGSPLPNAHLLGLFHRICKLLFYKIRPVFVFDGGVPYLKRQTVEQRQQKKSKAVNDAERVREKLINNLIKHKVITAVLENRLDSIAVPVRTHNVEADMFALPPAVTKETKNSSEADEQSSSEDEYLSGKHIPKDLHSIDVKSEHFKNLPADVRHEILTELKETRKQNSWGQLHKMPKVSDDFSTYQMERLLKRRLVQVSLEETEKEMGGHTLSLREMEEMLKERGVDTTFDMGKRIASDNVTRYIYITESDKDGNNQNKQKKDVQEICVDDPHESMTEVSEILSVIEDGDFESDWSEEDHGSNSESELCDGDKNLKLAKDFIFQNSGLTQKQILKLIKQQRKVTKTPECNKFITEPSTSGLNQKDISLKEDVKLTSATRAEEDEKSYSELGNSPLTNGDSLPKIQISTTSNVNVTPAKEDEKPCLELGTHPPHTNEKSLTKIQYNTVNSISIDGGKVAVAEANAQKEVPVLITESSVSMQSHMEGPDTSPKNSNQSLDTNLQQIIVVSSRVDEESSKMFDTNSESIKDSENVGEVVQISSDSDGDFEEVDVPQTTYILENSQMLEIKISKSFTEIKDDIFADIFSKDKLVGSDNTEKLECSVTDINKTAIETKEPTVRPTMDIESKQQEPTTPKADMSDSCINPIDNHIAEVCSKEPESELELLTKAKTESKIIFHKEELQQMKESLAKEQNILLSEQGKQDRLAASISEQMTLEAQELIQLFGLPYILAPMEAEAQCAFLDAVSLTEGTITDDSDIWLFGGQKVYKNFFNQKKHVIRFQAVDIQQYFKLTRQQLIALALLVGSDYTIGLQGVGPVTALEILSSFPCGKDDSVSGITEGLQKFREWWVSGSRMGSGGKAALRNKLKNIRLSEGFPNRAVVEAYFHPEVDQSKDTFTWGSPDLAALRSYTQEKFGWNQKKADDILLPVMKKLSERNMQRSITSYFQVKPVLKSIEGKLSKRVQKAVSQIDRGEDSSEDVVLEPKIKRQRKTKVSNTQLDEQGSGSSGTGRGKERAGGRGQRLPFPTNQPSEPTGEFIMQRQKDKINALNNKLKAIEVYRKSKKGLDSTAPSKKVRRKELPEAKLSESSESD